MDGFWWLLLLLGPLLFLQRRLHFETQAVFLLLSRSREIALVLFSLLFFPGVVLHETSHFVAARLLGVRTGRFSLLPQALEGGRLQLGYVETASTDIVRDALIGLAPLLAGAAFVAYAGITRLGLPEIWVALTSGNLESSLQAAISLPRRPDFWIWFYLVFAVSSTMLPSPSDRRAWLPVLLAVGVLIALAVLAGGGPWIMDNLAPYVNQMLRALALVLGITVAVHLLLLPPTWALRSTLSRLTGLQVR
jgi:hypothetical protein